MTHSPHKTANNPQKAARRSEKKTVPGTQGQMKPMSSKELGRFQAPGPAFPGMRPPRKSGTNIFNDNPGGTRKWNKINKVVT